MEENPYSKFVEMMRGAQSTSGGAAFRIGTVISGGPLRIDVGGAVQDGGSLVALAPQVSVAASVSESEGHTHEAVASASPDPFNRGDRALLIPIEDEQRYIVLGRLVGL